MSISARDGKPEEQRPPAPEHPDRILLVGVNSEGKAVGPCAAWVMNAGGQWDTKSYDSYDEAMEDAESQNMPRDGRSQ